MKNRFLRFFSLLIISLTSFSQVLTPVQASPPQQAQCTLSGIAFRDFNADTQQGSLEPPVEGIQVQAVDASGAIVDTALSGADGTYSLTVPDGVEVRIQFDNVPSFLRFGPVGGQSSPDVTFETLHQHVRSGEYRSGEPRSILQCQSRCRHNLLCLGRPTH